MDFIISHQAPPTPPTVGQSTSDDPFGTFEAFIAAGHDPEIDHWMTWELQEYAAYAASFLGQAAQHQTGGQR